MIKLLTILSLHIIISYIITLGEWITMKLILACKKGFTLVELLVVMAIIAIIAAIFIPNVIGFMRDSKISAANANAKTIHSTAIAYVQQECGKGKTVSSEAGTGTSGCMKDLLSHDFLGNWAFVVSPTGDGVTYALWSREVKVSTTDKQLSSDDQEDMSLKEMVGCYPLAN